MRRFVAAIAVLAFCAVPAQAAAPARGEVFCWDFDLAGTDAIDDLEGTAGHEHAAGYGGPDRLILFGGDDCATGGAGADVIHLGPGNDTGEGGGGDDVLTGGPGDEILLAGLGADRLDGGEGDDLLRDERGDADPDVLVGGEGHDVIRSANGGPDVVDCGPGWDVVIVDASDTLSGCDDVRVARFPEVAAHTLRTGVRPAFRLRWKATDLPLPAGVETTLIAHPGARPGCGVGSWRSRGTRAIRLSWHGARGACPGRYVFRLTHHAVERVACELLAGAPSAGCRRAEVLGEVAVGVL